MAFLKESEDWHRSDIISALRKRNTNLCEVSRKAGYSSTTLANALDRRWPLGQKIIADAIGVSPEIIWPSRYQNDVR